MGSHDSYRNSFSAFAANDDSLSIFCNHLLRTVHNLQKACKCDIFSLFTRLCACSQILTVSLGKVRVRVQMGSAHVVAVPLRTDPSLLRSLVAVARR